MDCFFRLQMINGFLPKLEKINNLIKNHKSEVFVMQNYLKKEIKN